MAKAEYFSLNSLAKTFVFLLLTVPGGALSLISFVAIERQGWRQEFFYGVDSSDERLFVSSCKVSEFLVLVCILTIYF